MEEEVLNKTKKFIFATCGDWDLKTMLKNQLEASEIKDPPEYFAKWINIKSAFESITGSMLGKMLFLSIYIFETT